MGSCRFRAAVAGYAAGDGMSGRSSKAPVPKPRKYVEDLLRRAGAASAPAQVGRSLNTESVLVFSGVWHQTLLIYGPDGGQIGTALRFKDRRSEVGYRFHDELRNLESELRYTVRDTTPRGLSRTHRFVVLNADEAEIGTITQSGSGTDRYEIAVNGRLAAIVQSSKSAPVAVERSSAVRRSSTRTGLLGRGRALWERLNTTVWTIETAEGDRVAQVTLLASPRSLWTKVAYVLELDPRLDESHRAMALGFCMAADGSIDYGGGGGGG
jgi:hypothetical protein